jgi:hypothetical protein
VARKRSGWVAALIVAAAAAAVLWTPSGSSAPTMRSALTISDISASFSDPDRATTYSVGARADAGAKFIYYWSLVITAPAGQVDPTKGVDPGCNNHGVLESTAAAFVWHHGNTGDAVHDDGCNHDLQGKWGHQGLIAVIVRDGLGNQCTATYKGSYSSDANDALGQEPASVPVCGLAPPTSPPPPPPQPPPCKCLLMTARIVPSSLKLKVGYVEHNGKRSDAPDRYFTFTIHWVLNCSKGSGGCNGRLAVVAPDTPKLGFYWSRAKYPDRDPQVFSIACKGACAALSDGGAKLQLAGHPHGGGTYEKLNKDWEHARFKFLIKRICQGKKIQPVTIVIALDETGKKIDLKKSKLG